MNLNTFHFDCDFEISRADRSIHRVDKDSHGFEVKCTGLKFEDPILNEILSNFPDLLLNAMSSLQDWLDSSSLKTLSDKPLLYSLVVVVVNYCL